MMQQGEWAAAPGPSRQMHRRSRSEGAGGALQDSASLGGFDLQGAGHLRTISLDTSASNFLQSLQLHDVSALQAGMLDAAEAAALDQQYDAAAMAAASGRPYAAASPKFAGAAAAVAAAAAGDHGWQPAEGAAVSAGSKRAHSGNGRVGKDSLQEGKKESLHQHKHSFTPALPAVDEAEDAAGPSDRDDEDYRESDSDRECYAATPRARRSSHSGRGRARRGGYNGRSENELMLLDPKRVKRIMANRQSAARSKERRMNYTMQLESKLQSIHSEVDRLHAQLEGMQGQGKLLLQARTELEQQVESMQQQLSQAAADNQVLVSELFALQSALGLPQSLPQPDMAAAGQPLDVQQQHGAHCSWQHDGGYSQQGVAGSSAAGVAGAAGSSYPGASAGPSSAGYAVPGGSRQVGAAAAGSGMPPLPRHHARSPNMQPMATAGGQPQSGQQTAARQQQQQGVLAGAVDRPSSPRIPSPSPAAAAAAAAVGVPAGPTVVVPADRNAAAGAAAAAGMPSNTAAAAADLLLLDQLAAVGEDAAMTNADDLDMLAALLDYSPMDPAAAAAAAAVPADQLPAAAGAGLARSAQQQLQQQQPFPAPLDPAAAAAVPQPLPAGNGSVRGACNAQATAAGMHAAAHAHATTPGYSSQQQQQQLGQFGALQGSAQRPPPQHPSSKAGAGTGVAPHAGIASWSVQSPPGSNATAAGFAGGIGGYGRSSPAFSDPFGAEGYHDEVSSGSLGGSLTPSTRLARVSDGSSIAAGSGGQRLPPPIWRQQQQHAALPQVADGGSAAGAAGGPGVGGAWGLHSLHTPPATQQPGSSAAAAAAAAANGLTAAGGAGNAWQPISPGEAAMHQQQQHLQAAGPAHAGAAGPAAAAAAAGGPGSALLPPGADQVNFVMGANPRQRFSAGKHHRSASAGSVSSLGWTDADRSWAQQLHSSGVLQQQQHVHHALGPDAAAAAAAGGSSRIVGRASAPGGASVLAAFDMHGPAPYRSNSSEGMAAMQLQQQQQGSMRQVHHRRSCSYAGAGGGLYSDAAGMPGQHWSGAAAAGGGPGGMPNSSSCGELSMQLHPYHPHSHQQQQQLEGIHPAALGPAGAAGLPDVSMQQFAGMARAAPPVGADIHALAMPTRIVTTGGSAGGLGGGVAPSLQQQQQQQRQQHYMM